MFTCYEVIMEKSYALLSRKTEADHLLNSKYERLYVKASRDLKALPTANCQQGCSPCGYSGSSFSLDVGNSCPISPAASNCEGGDSHCGSRLHACRQANSGEDAPARQHGCLRF